MPYVKINRLYINIDNKNSVVSLTTFPCNIHTVPITVFRALILCYPEKSGTETCISEKDTLTKFQAHTCTLWPLRAMIISIAIHYALDGPKFKILEGERDFPFSIPVQIGSFPGVKQPGCGINHPLISSAKVSRATPPTPICTSHGML